MAEKTLLTIVQDFCKGRGLPVPAVAFAATDDTTVQIVQLLNEGMQEMIDRYDIQQLITLASFTHVGGGDYLALDFNTANPDWKFNEQLTLWNLSSRIPVAGPLTMKDWQTIVTLKMAAAQYQYTLYNNGLHIYPAPNPLNSVNFGFYYQSKAGVLDNAQVWESYQSDASTPRIPTYLVEADIRWRWKKEKGLPYAEDQRSAESMLINMVGRTAQPALNLDGSFDSLKTPGPGIFIQPGTWPVS